MTTSQPIGVCILLINSNSQVLLGKRKNSYKSGMYGLPGGRIETNEKISAAISRETTEETGLKNLKCKYIGVVRENQGGYDFIHFVFTAKVESQEPVLCEPHKCEGWEWFDLDSELESVLAGHRVAIALFKNSETMMDLTTGVI